MQDRWAGEHIPRRAFVMCAAVIILFGWVAYSQHSAQHTNNDTISNVGTLISTNNQVSAPMSGMYSNLVVLRGPVAEGNFKAPFRRESGACSRSGATSAFILTISPLCAAVAERARQILKPRRKANSKHGDKMPRQFSYGLEL